MNWIRSEGNQSRRVFIGFDFPIGLAETYARIAGIGSFRTVLPELGSDKWSNFFEVARSREQISTARPFYPYRPGGTKRQDLVDGLGVGAFEALRRRCERSREGRRAACPMFWTLGGNQVGKGAIVGWRDVIIPLLRHLPGKVRIWPFDGVLDELLQSPGIVVAETYPAEFYDHLGIALGKGGKRKREGRRGAVGAIRSWAERTDTDLSVLSTDLDEAFGDGPSGEDRFDALVGLLGMINVILGFRPPIGRCVDPVVGTVEGWILGQTEVGQGK